MYLWGTISGFMIAIFPCMLLQRVFGKSPFLGISYPYLKGAVFGFMVWVMAGVIMYLDLRYNVIGFMAEESGGTLIVLHTHSHFGFITGGIAVAYFAGTMDILRSRDRK